MRCSAALKAVSQNSSLNMVPQFIIIHHSATLRDKTTFKAVDEYHRSLGWGGCGYHYFIEANGHIWQARKDNQEGCHCLHKGLNGKSIGICLAGNFCEEEPTGAQLKSLEGFLDNKSKEFLIPIKNILGHQETGAITLCPGKNLLIRLQSYRINRMEFLAAKIEAIKVKLVELKRALAQII